LFCCCCCYFSMAVDRRAAPARACQPSINVTDAALRKPSAVSKALSDMLANFNIDELLKPLRPADERIRRMQYFEGDAGNKSSGEASLGGIWGAGPRSGDDEEEGDMQLSSMAGITEFVQVTGSADDLKGTQKGISYLKGKMKKLEAPVTPRNAEVPLEVSVKDCVAESIQARKGPRKLLQSRRPTSLESNLGSEGAAPTQSRSSSAADSSSACGDGDEDQSIAEFLNPQPLSPFKRPPQISLLRPLSPASGFAQRRPLAWRPPSLGSMGSTAGTGARPGSATASAVSFRSISGSLATGPTLSGGGSGISRLRRSSSGSISTLSQHERASNFSRSRTLPSAALSPLGSQGSCAGAPLCRPASASRPRPRPMGRHSDCGGSRIVPLIQVPRAQASPSSGAADCSVHVSMTTNGGILMGDALCMK